MKVSTGVEKSMKGCSDSDICIYFQNNKLRFENNDFPIKYGEEFYVLKSPSTSARFKLWDHVTSRTLMSVIDSNNLLFYSLRNL